MADCLMKSGSNHFIDGLDFARLALLGKAIAIIGQLTYDIV